VPSVSMLLSSSCERSPEPTHDEAFGQSPVIRFSGSLPPFPGGYRITTCNTSTRDRARKRRPGEGRIVCIELLRCSKDWPHLPRRLPPESVDDYCALWLRLSFSVLGKGHLASGDHNQTGHRQRSTRDEHTQPEKAERDRRLHR
jgi:hypothetical protein